MDELEKELKEDFLQEAAQLLEDSEQAFLALENESEDEELVNQIFRLAHNLKGTSRAVGFGGVAEFTHEFENMILKIKEKVLVVDDKVVSLLLESNDHLIVMIKMLNMDLDAVIDSSELILKIQNLLSSPKEKESDSKKKKKPAVVLNLAPKKVDEQLDENQQDLMNQLNLNNNENDNNTSEKKPLDPVEEPSQVNQDKIIPQIDSPPSTGESKKKIAPKKDETIRVSLGRVEDLNNFVGELVILQTVLKQCGEEISNNELLLKSLRHLGKLSNEIQELAMSLRMVPLKTTMQKMGRIVRDTSKALDKQVELVLDGEDTEIDKTVLELLADPLVHIVRNAVDHGLGTPSEREAVGKDPTGILRLRAFHEGNNLLIELKDDGKGIDPKIIRKIAIKKNVISEKDDFSEDEIINLIFHPGFSTKEQVTEVSGRGVGMDVVKNNIENLSGEIIVNSTLGEGSIFTIRLPLTLAIIEGMIVDSHNEKFIIPIAQITESLRTTKDEIHFITGVGNCLDLRGEVIPIFDLQSAFYKNKNVTNYEEKTVIVIRNEQMRFAVMVDQIVNQQQVVIKKLGREIQNRSGFMGSAILGDGHPALIIDLAELFGSNIKLNKSSKLASKEL